MPAPGNGRSWPAYGAAIVQVWVGIAIVGTMLAGFAPVAERWGLLKPAHAWLNVFGFLSVVVAATLVHLAPTVAGTRIVPRRAAALALSLLVAAPPLVALGLAIGEGAVARFGALIEVLGATALLFHSVRVWRDRGRWTTIPAWRRMTVVEPDRSAPMRFLVAVVLASGRLIMSRRPGERLAPRGHRRAPRDRLGHPGDDRLVEPAGPCDRPRRP